MDTKVNYTLVGSFVLVLLAALIIIGIWIGRHGDTKVYNTYAVNMGEAVSGLSLRGPVKFNGVNVGFVKSIGLDKADPRNVHLVLSIEEHTPINESTVATLDSQGVTGISYIEVKTPVSGAPPLKKLPGQDCPLIKWSPSVLFQLDTAFRDLNGNIRSITVSFNELLNKQNLQSIQDILANIATLTGTLANNSKSIDAFMQNGALASKNFPVVMKELQDTLRAINTASSQLGGAGSKTLNNSNIAVETFSQQTLPAALETLNRMNNLLNNLQQVTTQLQNNPSVLLRGSRLPALGPGER